MPERDVVAAPGFGVGEALAFIAGDIIAHRGQRDDRDPGRLYGAVLAALVIDKYKLLTDARKRLPGQVFNRSEGGGRLLPRSTAASSRSPRPPSPS